jgi:hypothetical protein
MSSAGNSQVVVILTTSALQVVHAAAALEMLSERQKMSFSVSVVVIHPALNARSKELIKKTAKHLGFGEIHDFSHIWTRFEKNQDSFNNCRTLSALRNTALKRNSFYQCVQNTVRKDLQKAVGPIDVVVVRKAHQNIEDLFLRAIDSRIIYAIDDGIGDYVPRYWAIWSLNKHDLHQIAKERVKTILAFFVSILVTGQWHLSHARNLRFTSRFTAIFSSFDGGCPTSVGLKVREKILFLGNGKGDRDVRILIIGSLTTNPRFGFTMTSEVEVYNRVILKILERHDVNVDQIWYVPHPRASMREMRYKKGNLPCKIFETDEPILSEQILSDPSIEAVYTVGSTSMLYAKTLFHVQTFCIDISGYDVHPSGFRKGIYVANKFGIPVIQA